MAATKTVIARRLVEKYAEELKSNQMNKSQLARMLVAEYPKLFANKEDAREVIRAVTGCKGKSDGRVVVFDYRSTIEQGLESIGMAAAPPAHIPDPFRIYGPGLWGFICDVHIPDHDSKALGLALAHIAEAGAENLFINGDLVDFHHGSGYVHDPRIARIPQELHALSEFFKLARELFKGRIVWKWGNHEARVSNFILQKAPELVGVPGLTLREMSRAEEEFGVEIVEDKQFAFLGKLGVLHGHEFAKGIAQAVNPARRAFLQTKSCTIIGHHHQTSEHHESALDGTPIACWSVGCLTSLNPHYAPAASLKQNHGFAMVELDDDGHFTVRNHRIMGGKVR